MRTNPDLLIEDPKKELKGFTIAMIVPMGPNRARGRGSFVESVLHAVDAFYSSVVQNLKEWSAPPPQLRTRRDVEEATIEPETLVLSEPDSVPPEETAEVPAPSWGQSEPVTIASPPRSYSVVPEFPEVAGAVEIPEADERAEPQAWT